MKRALTLSAAAIVLTLLIPSTLLGWGPEGHEIVASLAQTRLIENSKRGIRSLIGDTSLASVANWADEVRPERDETYNWHFVDNEGKQQNTPSVRFGNISMMPREKIESKDGYPQESFLVEMRSLSGYSGSAVLIYSPCAMNDMSQRRHRIQTLDPVPLA